MGEGSISIKFCDQKKHGCVSYVDKDIEKVIEAGIDVDSTAELNTSFYIGVFSIELKAKET